MSKDEWKKLTKNERKKWVGVVGRMLLAYALVFAQGAWATQNQAAKDKPASPQKAAAQQAAEKQPATANTAQAQTKQAQGEESERVAEEKASGDGRHESIKVHGHWTIEVRDPDGTLVTHREFENALFTPQFALYAFLSRTATVGTWAIQLGGGPAGNICTYGGNPGCYITEPSTFLPPTGSFLNLVPSISGNNFVLSGTAVANVTGSVGYVFTFVAFCPPSIATSSCTGSNQSNTYEFTVRQVTPEIPVSSGQTVAVTVNISFS